MDSDEKCVVVRKNGDIWKPLFFAASGICITLIGCWLSIGVSVVTHDQLNEQVPPPFVLSHISDTRIHENDKDKRARIRDVLVAEHKVLMAELNYLRRELDGLRKDVEELMP